MICHRRPISREVCGDRFAFQGTRDAEEADAAVTAFLAVMVLVILFDSSREWLAILSRRKIPILREAEYLPSAIAGD